MHSDSPLQPIVHQEELRKHPAKFSDRIYGAIIELLDDQDPLVLIDPFAGTGGIFAIQSYFPRTQIHAIEIEPEWVAWDSRMRVGNALELPFPDNTFDTAVTSPAYGNRMADHHEAKDGSKRHTYRHYLGRPLNPDNSGQLQWGKKYKEFHTKAWIELKRVLQHNSVFILNCKDHIRAGKVQKVCAWHIECLESLGFVLEESREVELSGNGMGQNGQVRVPYEQVIRFRLRKLSHMKHPLYLQTFQQKPPRSDSEEHSSI